MLQPTGSIMQVAYVVPDMEAAAAQAAAALGAGPFYLLPHLQIVQPRYRGEPSAIDCSIALGFSGGLCVEFIQQHNDAPSVFREHLDRSGPGFQHWGVMTTAFDADIARYGAAGHPVAFSGAVAVGGRFAYVDTVATLGGMIELIELTPPVAELFRFLGDAAAGWDGSEPLRSFPA
jgi:Glyoxalase/Bleomycin resistance protein/Dioxygenase superfamily